MATRKGQGPRIVSEKNTPPPAQFYLTNATRRDDKGWRAYHPKSAGTRKPGRALNANGAKGARGRAHRIV